MGEKETFLDGAFFCKIHPHRPKHRLLIWRVDFAAVRACCGGHILQVEPPRLGSWHKKEKTKEREQGEDTRERAVEISLEVTHVIFETEWPSGG